ncbi:hypothetical protein LPJ63_002488 [Coemansia sp. RSA 2711]|nr:hypothetical protein LPJ63_002488 [Coemansia sp. RSA 2711]KAJ2307731.1 hypothetical protein IWW54_004300 [Coemansia sp. RSA 2705]KAJ2316101.1 hypothetical protein IWW51_005724 [Coemansia sp. RSA 2702]KAJ2375594.1 hypothetical protein H4S02_008178 [Coemansia sp. RSA 2611]
MTPEAVGIEELPLRILNSYKSVVIFHQNNETRANQVVSQFAGMYHAVTVCTTDISPIPEISFPDSNTVFALCYDLGILVKSFRILPSTTHI